MSDFHQRRFRVEYSKPVQVETDPRIATVIRELYARPPAEVAATFIMLGIDAGKAGWR